MTKICFVTTTSLTIKSFVLPIAEALHKELGWDVAIACAPDDDLKSSLPSFIYMHEVEMTRGVNFEALSAIRSLEGLFREEKFDVVQYSTPNASLYSSIASKRAGVKKRIYAQWGIRYVGFEGAKRLLFKALEKVTCRYSTQIFSVSPLNMAFAVDEDLCEKGRISVIGNGGTIGVDLSQFDYSKKNGWREDARRELGISESTVIFGFVGRFSRDKGCNELLAAIKKCTEKHPNSILLVVGPDEAGQEIDSSLFDWCKKAGCIRFTGFVPKDSVAKYCSAFDVLVHPTYREGFGMVIQEAGALAVPAITTDVPGASEVMENGKSYRLVSARNADALASAMIESAENPGSLMVMGRAARKRVELLYERSIMLNNQVDAYRGLL